MKIKAKTLLIYGVILFAQLVQIGCRDKSDNLVFQRNNNDFIIESRSGMVSVFNTDGSLLETLGSTAAGTDKGGTPLPPAIIHYLLLDKGSISGLVWEDLNGNRFLDADEKGVQGVRVYIDNDHNETYNYGETSELTDTNGFYSLPKVKPGTKSIYIDLDTLAGGYGITTGQPITLNLVKKQDVKDADFGVQIQGRSAEIDGLIWDQTDNAPIAGVRVYVDLNNDEEYTPDEPSSTTDSSGNYVISDIPYGTFNVQADNGTLDVKYHRTPVQGTNPTLITFVSPSSQTVKLTYLHKATICGALRDTSGRTWGNVTVYIDLNNSGTLDTDEPTTVTDSSGRYCFDELFPGEYTLRLLANPLWDGYRITSPGQFIVGEGEHSSDVDFIIQAQPVTITGFVWDDANGNGAREPVESGFANVTVFLDVNRNGAPDADEPSTLTDETGSLEFTGLEYGDFNIRAEDADLRNTHFPTTTPNPVHRTIAPGQTFDGARFGYQRKLAPVNTMTSPTRLAWGSDGSLYVSDNTTGSLFIYDSTMTVTGELKKLAKPLGVSTDNAGNIYVGNQGRKNVEVYDSGGNLLMSLGNGEIMTPNDIAVDRDDNIYILDSANDTVLVYDQQGTKIAAIGSSQQFKFPVSIAINYRDDGSGAEVGELYVADQPNCTIQVFTLDGTYLKSVGNCGNMFTSNWDGKFSGLVAVNIDRDGNIHGLDNNLNVIQVFEPQNGTFLRSYNAYPPENEYRPNLQTDFSIHPDDDRVVVGNFETKSVETITTIP